MMNRPSEIVCETSGGLLPADPCDNDEYCAGPNTLEEAACGKTLLCTKKGKYDFFEHYTLQNLFVYRHLV